MKKKEIVADIIKNLREIDNLILIEDLRKNLSEYINNKKYFGQYNKWSLLLSKVILINYIKEKGNIIKSNKNKLENSEFLNNFDNLKDELISLNDTVPFFVKHILEVIE